MSGFFIPMQLQGMAGGRLRCARTLDRPITIFGLEPSELVAVGGVAGAVMFAIDSALAVVVGVACALTLRRLRAGKSPGYLFERLYRSGWARYLPGGLRVPHLLRPPHPWQARQVQLEPILEEESHEAFYWSGRERLP